MAVVWVSYVQSTHEIIDRGFYNLFSSSIPYFQFPYGEDIYQTVVAMSTQFQTLRKTL